MATLIKSLRSLPGDLVMRNLAAVFDENLGILVEAKQLPFGWSVERPFSGRYDVFGASGGHADA